MRGQLKALTALGALVLLLAAVAGCGGDDNNDSATTTTSTTSTTETETGGSGGASGGARDTDQTLEIEADPTGALKFTTDQLSAKPGKVTIQMGNPSTVQHAVAIIGNGVSEKGNTVGQGGTSTVTAELGAGRYDFYCPVGGHQQAGMQGTLTIGK